MGSRLLSCGCPPEKPLEQEDRLWGHPLKMFIEKNVVLGFRTASKRYQSILPLMGDPVSPVFFIVSIRERVAPLH